MDDTQSITSEMSIYRRKEETSNLIHDPRDIVRSHEKSLTLILLQDILQIKGNYFSVLNEANYSKDKIVSIVSLAPEEQRSSISNDFPPFDLDEDQHGCDLLFYLYYPFRYNLVIGKQSVELNDRVTVSLEMNNRSDEFVLRLSFPPENDNENPYLLLKFARRSSMRKWQKKIIDILLDLLCMKSLKDIYSVLCFDEDEGKPKSPQKEMAIHNSIDKTAGSRFQYDLFYTILSEFNRKLLQIQEIFQLNYSSNAPVATPLSTTSAHSRFSFSTKSISNNTDQLSYYLQKFLSSHYFLSNYFKISQITFEFISFLKTLARPSGLLSRAYGFAEDSTELKEMEKIVSLVIRENLQTFFMKNDYYIAFNEQIQRITNENTIVKTLDNEQTTIAELNEEEALQKLTNSQKFQETEEQFVRSAKFFASIPNNNNAVPSQRLSRSLSDLSISSAIPEGGSSFLPPRVGSGRYLDLTANHLSLMNKMHLQPGSSQPSNSASHNNLLSSRNSDLGSIQSDLPSIISQGGGGRQNATTTTSATSNVRRVGSGTNLKRIIKFNGIELTNPNQINNCNNSSINKEDLPIPGQIMQNGGKNASNSNKDTNSPLVNQFQKSPVQQKNAKNDEDETSDLTFMTEKENKNSQSLFDPIHSSGIKKEKEHIQRILSEMIFPLAGEEEKEPVPVTSAVQEKKNQTEEIPLGYDEFPDEFILRQTVSPLLSKPLTVTKEKVENENRKTLQESNLMNGTPITDERNEQRTLSSSISRSADSNKVALPVVSISSPKPPSVAASPSHHYRKRSNSKSQSNSHSTLSKRRSSSGGDHEETFSVLDLPGDNKSSPMPSSDKHKKKTHKEKTAGIPSEGEEEENQGYSPEIHQGGNDKSPKVFDIFKIVLCFFIVGLLWYNMTHPELFLKNNKMKRPSLKINSNNKNKKMPAPQQQQKPARNSPTTVQQQQQQLKRQQQLKQFFQQQPTNLEGNNYFWKDNPKPVMVAVDNPQQQQTIEELEVAAPPAQVQESTTTAPKFIMIEELQQENDLDEQIAQKLKKLQQLEEMNQRIKEIESFSDPLDVIDPVVESDQDQEGEEEVVLPPELEENEVGEGEGIVEEEITSIPVSTNNRDDEIIIEQPSREQQQFPSDRPEKFSQNNQMNMNNMNNYTGSTSLQVRPKAFSNFFQNIFFSLKMKMKSFFGRFVKK
jgi:hypothetical protein